MFGWGGPWGLGCPVEPGTKGLGMPDQVGHDDGLAIGMLQNGAVVRNGRGPSGGVAARGLVSGRGPQAKRSGRDSPEGAYRSEGPRPGGRRRASAGASAAPSCGRPEAERCPVGAGHDEEGMPDRVGHDVGGCFDENLFYLRGLAIFAVI